MVIFTRGHRLFGLLLSGLVLFAAHAGATELSKPEPSMDNPRKIVLALSSNDPDIVDKLLSNAVNVQKFYSMDNVRISIIAYTSGVRAFLNDESKVAERISSLQRYGIEFVACGNTMDTIGKKREDLLAGVKWAQVGLAELVERQLRGWIVLQPY